MREEIEDMEDEKINPVLKFPEIKRETPFVKASLPENSNSKYNSLNQQSLSSFSNLEQQPRSSHTDQNVTANQEEYADDLNDRDNCLSANILPSHVTL